MPVLSIVGTDGVEAKAITAALARPHARAIAGDAPEVDFDSVGQVFSLMYDTPTADGVTEISVSESAYPSGYRVEFAEGCVDS